MKTEDPNGIVRIENAEQYARIFTRTLPPGESYGDYHGTVSTEPGAVLLAITRANQVYQHEQLDWQGKVSRPERRRDVLVYIFGQGHDAVIEGLQEEVKLVRKAMEDARGKVQEIEKQAKADKDKIAELSKALNDAKKLADDRLESSRLDRNTRMKLEGDLAKVRAHVGTAAFNAALELRKYDK